MDAYREYLIRFQRTIFYKIIGLIEGIDEGQSQHNKRCRNHLKY